nr:hypothetical protein [Paracoccus saliphilus]
MALPTTRVKDAIDKIDVFDQAGGRGLVEAVIAPAQCLHDNFGRGEFGAPDALQLTWQMEGRRDVALSTRRQLPPVASSLCHVRLRDAHQAPPVSVKGSE